MMPASKEKRAESIASETARIHRACNLLADSAIAADDAIAQNDVDAVDKAVRAISRNARTACKLCIAWRAHHA